MKFAIRDDDLNYFFQPNQIESNYKDIWDICPVSMSVVPFIKGDWKKQISDFEISGPGIIKDHVLKSIHDDSIINPIGKNIDLVKFVNNQIKKNRIYLTIHAIHHRNEDLIVPQFKSNYGIGAEFYTSRDLYEPLKAAIKYLETTFDQVIKVFTPPQNLLNLNGINSVTKNSLAICGNFPRMKNISTIKLFGIFNYFKYGFVKYVLNFKVYPFVLSHNDFRFVGHHSLQPSTNIEDLYLAFEKNYKLANSVFVISTHSYGFDSKMKKSNKTMGVVLKEFVEYAAKKRNIQFVTIKEIFDDKI
jgi:hypothetical protein